MEENEITGFILISMGGMLIMALGLILLYRISKKQLVKQFEEKEKLKEAHQHELLEATIDSQERERKRIASELHDHIGSNLQALKLFLHQLGMGNLEKIEQQSTELLTHTIQDVKNLSHELMPASLTDLGLEEALKTLTARLNASEQIACELDCSSKSRLDADAELALYRITQELCSNTLQHAQASRIKIGLHVAPPTFHLVYEDDGIGLPGKGGQTGLGLKNIESRCQMLNAELQLDTGSNEGGFKLTIHNQTQSHEQ